MKFKLFQLVLILLAVVTLARAGFAKIQYFEDFESFKNMSPRRAQ